MQQKHDQALIESAEQTLEGLNDFSNACASQIKDAYNCGGPIDLAMTQNSSGFSQLRKVHQRYSNGVQAKSSKPSKRSKKYMSRVIIRSPSKNLATRNASH